MKRFCELFTRLDRTRKTSEKLAALRDYFREAPPEDAAWAVYVLKGEKMRRRVKSSHMRDWVAEEAGIPLWLLEASYAEAGDLAETLARLWPGEGPGLDMPLHKLIEDHLPRPGSDPPGQKERLRTLWSACTHDERFLLNKLLTGGFRMGVARGLTARALAETAGLEPAQVEHRLMGTWEPTAASMRALLAPAEEGGGTVNQPYPFYLASPLTGDVSELGPAADWQAEWKWDGIRAQLLVRGGEVMLWSRGEEVITDGFPEIVAGAELLPDGTVLDGEILAWRDEAALPFGALQRRINRRNPGVKLRTEVPVIFMVYDCMEVHGVDIRSMPLYARQTQALPMFGTEDTPAFRVSEPLDFSTWEQLAALRNLARERGVEGVMLKRTDSPYLSGRKRGDWWKWKVDPFRLDAVMVYAQAGHGRRAGLYTDYTFALRDGDGLVPFAKAYSGLTDAEMKEVDAFIRKHTLEKHGPVRVVEPKLVCEVAFEGVQVSKRHKCGLAVRFPRVSRLRNDKAPEEIDTVDALRDLTGPASETD
jgi:DNA ligase-1